jgi:TPR repeat protein
MYYKGLGRNKDLDKAKKYFTLAADLAYKPSDPNDSAQSKALSTSAKASIDGVLRVNPSKIP